MKYIIGIDEVGRGSIAGPVTVAVLAMPKNFKILSPKPNLKLKDSKKLSPKQRELWFEYVKSNGNFFYTISHVQPSVIDRINISNAANLAALKAFKKLEKKMKNYDKFFEIKKSKITLDGSLYIGNKKDSMTIAETKIRADESLKEVALASIVAKISRDRLIKKMDKKHKGYNLYFNKGYGTKSHFLALKNLGPSKIHRLTFI